MRISEYVGFHLYIFPGYFIYRTVLQEMTIHNGEQCIPPRVSRKSHTFSVTAEE